MRAAHPPRGRGAVPPARERGVVLVNVLLTVALAAGVIAVLAVAGEAGLDRGIRYADAAAADAAIDGGELSAITALRRDKATAPRADTLDEPWARIGDRAARIEGGRFSLAVADAQGKLDLNGLARNDAGTMRALVGVAGALGLDPAVPARVLALERATGPLASLDALALAGLDRETIARLAAVCTVLPLPAKVNLNTAPEPLLAALVGDPVAARLLIARRARGGGLTAEDLALARTPLPPVAGYTSDLYWVRTRVTIHGLTRERASLIRRDLVRGRPIAGVIARWNGRAPPLDAPGLG